MGAKMMILANPYTYNFLKVLIHSALKTQFSKVLGTLQGAPKKCNIAICIYVLF